jgi:hypothetical protein
LDGIKKLAGTSHRLILNRGRGGWGQGRSTLLSDQPRPGEVRGLPARPHEFDPQQSQVFQVQGGVRIADIERGLPGFIDERGDSHFCRGIVAGDHHRGRLAEDGSRICGEVFVAVDGEGFDEMRARKFA